MKKGALALAITLTAFGSIPANSAEVNRWEAKDPYAGTKYEKEDVSRFAKVSNGVVTIASGLGMIGYTANYVHENSKTVSYLLPYLNYSFPHVPTGYTIAQFVVATTTLFALGIPANMLITYGAKKGATLVGNVLNFGWDVFKYGFTTVKYQFDHVRATYLQGTLWQNNNVIYVKKTD